MKEIQRKRKRERERQKERKRRKRDIQRYIQGVSKKPHLFYLEYLQVGLVKSIVHLGGYLVLPYDSSKINCFTNHFLRS